MCRCSQDIAADPADPPYLRPASLPPSAPLPLLADLGHEGQPETEDVVAAARRAAGRLPAGWTFTLPTEAQWEYACRAGTTGDYAGDLDAMAWYNMNSGSKTHEVGTKKANAWGLSDMHGNVLEWCADWYARYPSASSVTDPTGPSSGSLRVLRGGGWDDSAAIARPAIRRNNTPGYRYSILGFRLALVPQVSP